MISGESCKGVHNTGRWLCGVCGTSVGRNSIQCTNCQKWVRRKCSDTKGSMTEVSRPFVCTGFTDQPASTDRTSMDVSDGASLELVDMFCNLGDMPSTDGDADAAVEAEVRNGWNKFRQFVPLLTSKDISILTRGKSYRSCVCSCMLHGSET